MSSNEPVAATDQQVPALAAAGVWQAIGWCLLAVGVQFMVGLQFGANMGRFRQAPNAVDLFTLNGVCMVLGSAAIVACVYAGRVRRVVSLRCPNWFHVFLVLLLAVPGYVFAVSMHDCVASVRQGTAGAITEGMCSLLSTAAPQTERLAGLDKWFMELARESWLTILILGCVLPAVGEELFFRGFLWARTGRSIWATVRRDSDVC